MKVPHSKGVANHVVPESCGLHREVQLEALTGVRAGQPLSHEMPLILGADTVSIVEGNTDRSAIASGGPTRRGRRPWHARTHLAREPGDLAPGRDATSVTGPHREGEEPKPMMHGREKSDPAIVAKRPVNKAALPAAESVEQMAGAEGNARQQSTHRTQCRARVTQALDRVRKAAKERKK